MPLKKKLELIDAATLEGMRAAAANTIARNEKNAALVDALLGKLA